MRRPSTRIVLVHGLFGFDKIGPLEYFYGIPEDLRSNGAQVFVAQVSAANSTEVRGEQLLSYVKQVLAVTGAAKVNLIGHSHGGPTVRYVASVAPNLVASVTSVAGPNQGAALADALNGTLPAGSLSRSAIATIVNGFASVIELASGDPGAPQNSSAALDSLSTAGMAAFNAAHPEGLPTTPCGQGPAVVNNVRYYSWSGAQPYTNVLDPVEDPALALTALVYGSDKNDGLVGKLQQPSRVGDPRRLRHESPRRGEPDRRHRQPVRDRSQDPVPQPGQSPQERRALTWR